MAGRRPRALEIDVLKAALEVWCTQGLEAPLKTVGERVGISASAISQRVGSKHDLVNGSRVRLPLSNATGGALLG